MSQGARTDLAARVHGASGYRRGCRCKTCREAHRQEFHRYKKANSGDGRAGRKVRPPWNAVPAERIWPILEEWMNRNHQPNFWGDESQGVGLLARTVGCDPKAIYVIRQRGWMTFAKADRILCAIGRPDLWHSELADLYEAA